MPDQRERYIDVAETYRLAQEGNQSKLWTAMPGSVVAFPAASGIGEHVIDVQPTINAQYRDTSGNYIWVQMPVLLDCVVVWQGGGGVTSTFPIAEGDECLIVLASRCIDAWWQQGWKGGQSVTQPNKAMNPPDLRMHNLSDGFALVGLRSLPRQFAVDTANACLITDDGQTYFKLNPTTKAIAARATGGINLNGVTIDQNGNLTSPATIIGTTDVKNGTGTSLTNHVHPTGSPDTGPPVAGT
jgi:hypothetical protein